MGHKQIMISFIVIGRNEGWKLNLCLKSIYETIKYNHLSKYEVIYVDSDSSDNSLEQIKNHENLIKVKISGDINAAVARNVGADISKGSVLFFIDGDMEIMPDFLNKVYNENTGLCNDFVSGKYINYYYSQDWELLSKEKHNDTKEVIESVTGGLFLIKKDTWNLVGGMKNVFKRSQDIDLGLRLSKQNILLHRKGYLAAKHHTIHYFDKKRMWLDFFKFYHLYGRSLIYRYHLTNLKMYSRLVRNDYTAILFTILTILAALNKEILLIVFYPIIVLIRSKYRLDLLFYIMLRDISSLAGFFIFWPNTKKKHSIILM